MIQIVRPESNIEAAIVYMSKQKTTLRQNETVMGVDYIGDILPLYLNGNYN